MIIRDTVFSNTPPAVHNVLWIKAGDNNINTLYVYDGGWRKIGTSSGGGTSDYNDLENKPRINDVVLEGNLTLQELGVILPDLSKYTTEESLNRTLQSYAKKTDIPSVEGLLSKTAAESIYQKKGNYALKSDIPNTSDFITNVEVDTKLTDYAKKTDVPDISTFATKSELQKVERAIPDVSSFITDADVNNKLLNYATKSELPDTSNLATKSELNSAISEQKFKTINGQSVIGEGNIEIIGSGNIEIDTVLNPESNNAIANSAIAALLLKLDEKIFPTTLTVSGGGTYDEGTTQVVTVTWKLQKDGQSLTPDSITVNGEQINPSEKYKVFIDVSTNTTYNVVVTYKGKQYKGSTSVTFKKTYYRYYGGLPSGTEVGQITIDMVKGLKKEVCTSAAATLNYTCDDQRMSYAYPKVFGLLSAVIDPSFNGPYDNFPIEKELSIDGEPYYVYACDTASNVVDFKVKFQQ